jgi:hypothetical protein
VEELRDLIERRYGVVYQSKQSYYSTPLQVVEFLNIFFKNVIVFNDNFYRRIE